MAVFCRRCCRLLPPSGAIRVPLREMVRQTSSPQALWFPMTSIWADLSWLALAWLVFFCSHSVLASDTTKRFLQSRHPRLSSVYRLLYNVVALVSVVWPVWLMYEASGPWLWQWTGPFALVAGSVAILAVVGFLLSSRAYDTAEFLGLRQWRSGRIDTGGALVISTAHRFVRHPWYALALAIIWTRDMDAARLLSAVLVTGYFVVGSRLEEDKLIARFGSAYDEYRRRVPALVPLPWRTLSRTQAIAISAAGTGEAAS